MSVPGWLSIPAGLDDDALAALGNRGLVRRAQRLVADDGVSLTSSGDAVVELSVDGVAVRLLPGGPKEIRCPCPVAGVCLHVVAACVWARSAAGAVAADGEASPVTAEEQVAARVVPDVEVLAEVLGWDPAAVNRSSGIAAVRRVARLSPGAPDEVTIEPRGAQLVIGWPGSPRVIVVRGTGPSGIVVEGVHSEVAERAWRLEAIVRVFAAQGRPWPWPEGLGGEGGLLPAQAETAAEVAATAEALVHGGLSRVGRDGADRLSRAGQRARLEALPLLSRLAAAAAGQLRGLHARDDDITEGAAFSALAQAWALAGALRGETPNAALLGKAGGQADPVGTLIPLAVRWWHSASGSRGLTLHALDSSTGRLEEVTTGRAAGVDPSFTHSWTAPLLWGMSAEQLCAGPLTLTGAERRDDHTLSHTSRTTGSAGSWTDVDLDALAEQVDEAGAGAARVAFGAPDRRVRMLVPRASFGLGTLELDEVAQRFVWPVVDRQGRHHRLALDATPANAQLLDWLVEQGRLLAIVVLDDRPEAVFLPTATGPRLMSLTMTPLALKRYGKSWRRRLLRLDQHRSTAAPLRESNDLQRLCAAVGDVALTLAATGGDTLSSRQADTLVRRCRDCTDLGLGTLASAVDPLLAGPVEPAALLRVRFLLDRLEALVG